MVWEIELDHVKGLNWELFIKDDNFSLDGETDYFGHITVSSGLLWFFKSDETIAFIIAHEVGHGLARHKSEDKMDIILFIALRLLIGGVVTNMGLDLMLICLNILSLVGEPIDKYFKRRREYEADYIGIMLMASAGYDPSGALDFFDALGDDSSSRLLSTHPKPNKRAKRLKREKVTKKAQKLYIEAISRSKFKTT